MVIGEYVCTNDMLLCASDVLVENVLNGSFVEILLVHRSCGPYSMILCNEQESAKLC